MSLLLSCNSDICPDTADKSFWNVERNDSRESSKLTLVYEHLIVSSNDECMAMISYLNLFVKPDELFGPSTIFLTASDK